MLKVTYFLLTLTEHNAMMLITKGVSDHSGHSGPSLPFLKVNIYLNFSKCILKVLCLPVHQLSPVQVAQFSEEFLFYSLNYLLSDCTLPELIYMKVR